MCLALCACSQDPNEPSADDQPNSSLGAPADMLPQGMPDPGQPQVTGSGGASQLPSGNAGSDVAGMAGTGGSDAPIASGGVTYHKDIRKVIESSCLGCHVQGGIGPFPLDTWDAVSAVSAQVVGAVKAGVMPPWPANPDCRELRDDRALSPATRDMFVAWQSANYPEGDAADYEAPMQTALEAMPDATLVLSGPAKYTPAPDADDYRCFVVPYTFATDTYLTAMDIVPDVRAQVHHVQIHRVAADQLLAVQAMDTGDGYTCFNGTGAATQNMFSWRPGGARVVFDKGDAAFIEAGSGIVLQVHYNTQFLPEGQSPMPDQTKIQLWTLPEGELPDHIIYRTGMTALFDIPAGEPNAIATATSAMSTVSAIGGTLGIGGTFVPGEVIGMTPHAHQIASAMSASLQHGDGSSECVDDVPNWDFHWQLDYMFSKGVPYEATDEMTVTCNYDNSAAHQPVINGVQQQPRDVTWGESSLDEMCLHYIWLRFERDAFLSAR